MSHLKTDVIIIGAGVAGSSAAIRLAQKGIDVVLIDRAMPIGSKNLSGGVLWGDDLSEILPNWREEAPVERYLVNKKIGLLSEDDATIFDLHFNSWNEYYCPGVSVLRVPFDEWLAEKAGEAGAAVLSGISIDELIIENGKVIGVRQGEEELFANVVIIAEGVNNQLLLKHHMTYVGEQERYNPRDMMLGIKETIHVDQKIMEERFLLSEMQGMAGEFVLGNLPNQVNAGGFFYTNKDSISIGVVIHLDSLSTDDRSYQIMEYYKLHPYIAKLIKDGETTEYGAKLVPEYGIKRLPKLYGNGFLVIGDAAGFVFSNGMVIQGMNYAIKSGILAADAIMEAKKTNSYDEKALQYYEKILKKSYILKDLKKFRKVKSITKNPRIFHSYPDAINNTFKEMLTEKGEPKEKTIRIALRNFRKSGVGIFSLMKDGLGGRHI
ncbi:MAG: FAD-dependent oxidoreductase [Candidatus Kariarchaeaceae archaeon]|jgi:electron transfer flavoprotein-quinone oxidoreductase